MIIFMISIRLKDICNQYGVFIMTATQLNADYQESETPDQNLLRGAKSIADKIDVGIIMLEVTKKDLESITELHIVGNVVSDTFVHCWYEDQNRTVLYYDEDNEETKQNTPSQNLDKEAEKAEEIMIKYIYKRKNTDEESFG